MKTSIQELNDAETAQNLGAIVLVTALMAIGVVGNAHVLYVYMFHVKTSCRRTFILMLGVLDLTACSVGMPGCIFMKLNTFTLKEDYVCKLSTLINFYVGFSSVLMLLVIAIDRYRRVCFPMRRQMTRKMAKYLCLIVLLTSGMVSWPIAVLFDIREMDIPNTNISVSSCVGTDPSHVYDLFFYFVVFYCVCITLISCVLFILYCRIGKVVWEFQTRVNRGFATGNGSNDVELRRHHGGRSSGQGHIFGDHEVVDAEKREEDVICLSVTSGSRYTIVKHHLHNVAHKVSFKFANFIDIHRATLTFALISVTFIMTYVTHLTLVTLPYVQSNFRQNLSRSEDVVYRTFVPFFFIDNVANAFIYGFCDKSFREEVKILYSKCRSGFKMKTIFNPPSNSSHD